MAMMSNLPRDLAEEILSRVPLTSIRAVRSTCKKWNDLSKQQSFTKKQIGKAKAANKEEFQVIMMMDFRVYLMSVNLHGLHKNNDNVESSIMHKGKLISLDNADGVDISTVFHCDGLLLCITEDINSRLVVWNPYHGQTKWIKPKNAYHVFDNYSLGYERKNKSLRRHKILRFVDEYDLSGRHRTCEFEIYNLNSDSWKVLDVNADWDIQFYARGVSIKGNTYWFAQEKIPQGEVTRDRPDFLLCFDFTTERFGPRLPLPFHSVDGDTVTLSTVRETQIVVLFQCWDTYEMKIWISDKIEPYAVSWSKLLFLSVDMKPLTGFRFMVEGGSFFIEEKKKVVVVIDKDKDIFKPTRNTAYIIGKDGYFREVDLGEAT